MAVVVDHQTLQAEALGLTTVGQVLAHLQRDNRLVVHVLIDGQEPDLRLMGTLRRSPIDGHTLFIETADPGQLASDVLRQVEGQLDEAERLRAEASDQLRRRCNVRAMERLSGCFSTWQNAQESVLKTAQLLRIDLNAVQVAGRSLTTLLHDFTEQLRQIKSALENRDFVHLSDILDYEITQTSSQWRAALQAMRGHMHKSN